MNEACQVNISFTSALFLAFVLFTSITIIMMVYRGYKKYRVFKESVKDWSKEEQITVALAFIILPILTITIFAVELMSQCH